MRYRQAREAPNHKIAQTYHENQRNDSTNKHAQNNEHQHTGQKHCNSSSRALYSDMVTRPTPSLESRHIIKNDNPTNMNRDSFLEVLLRQMNQMQETQNMILTNMQKGQLTQMPVFQYPIRTMQS
jgi:hypothetical protein